MRHRANTPRLLMTVVFAGVATLASAQPVPAPPARDTPPTPAITTGELVRRVRGLLDSLSRADQFSGVISISRRGAPVFERAYGAADRARRIPNTIETAFNLGSINKLFTSIAVRQLAADGRLAPDSVLARAWPEFPDTAIANRVTIRQLLNHRSGVAGNIFAVPGVASQRDVRHNRQFLAAVINTPLAFPPGTRQQYSNAGYVVLGGVIERVSGEDYYSYVQRHIFAPAGMTRTGHFAVDSLPPGTAIGYTHGGDGSPREAAPGGPLRPNTGDLPGRGSAAGGGYSTVGDLKRLLAALRAGDIAAGPPAGVGIAGGTGGVNAVVEGSMPGGYDVIVLSNIDPPSAERISRQIAAWLGARD
jgi:D-alanyl-D-alanine carboxypeptidase